MKSIKAIFIAMTLTLGLMLSSSTALAAEFVAPDKESGQVSIDQEEPIKNLYTAGAIVTINTEIEKGLYVAGGSLIINGNVGQSLSAAGGTIIIRGDVGGSAHVGGGNIIIEGKIADDLIIGGGNITILSTSSIGGDIIVGGGNVVIEAPVLGSILVGAGQATINSKVSGSVKGQIENLTLGAKAEIGGDLEYKSIKEATWLEGAAVLGEVKFDEITKKSKQVPGFPEFDGWMIFGALFFGYLIKLIIFIITGLVLVYLLRKFTEPVLKKGLSNFWPSLGIGFAGLILAPIAAGILAITILGLGLAGLLMATYGLFFMLAMSMAHIFFGSWLIKTVKKRKEYKLRWQEVVLGAVVLSLVALIPLVGWLVMAAFILVSLGALFQRAHKAFLG